MSTNTLNVAYITGQIIQASHVNELTAALLNDFVGRNSLGEASTGRKLGNETYPWGEAFISNLKATIIEMLAYSSHENTSIGTDQTIAYANKIVTYLTGATLSSILDFDGKSEGRVRVVINKTGNTVIIKPTNVILPNNENLEVENGTILQLIYDNASAKWRLIGGGVGGSGGSKKIFGSVISPIEIDGTTSIAFTGSQDQTIIFLQGATDGITNLSGLTKQIADGLKIGQELLLVFTSGTRLIQMANGNNIIAAGPYLSDYFSALRLMWTGSTGWLDIKR